MEKRSVLANNKLTKTKYLLDHPQLKEYVPDTISESKGNLHAYLTRYRTVYVKPNNGTGGRGIIRVKIARDGAYVFQLKDKKLQFRTYDGLYKAIEPITTRKVHLIQKGIPLLKIKGRPFDIRVMVQKEETGSWIHTGTIARIARPKLVVTNYHSGGTPIELEKLLIHFLPPKRVKVYMKKLEALGVQIAEHMEEGYPFVTAIGVDIGLDAALRPWIIEVNTRPDPFIFKTLKDKRVFNRIYRYIRMNRSPRPERIEHTETVAPVAVDPAEGGENA
ncbi:YheC/YheD family protein [Gorillibacterium sp. CAU 1737]|uniref:YheC/YheD family protein n=1 Tax=Gorillibacterium sp. CAU 1737 TaxID=3140362 RepID=UPI003260EB63